MRARMHEYAGALSFLMPRASFPMSDDASGGLHPRDSFPHGERSVLLGTSHSFAGIRFMRIPATRLVVDFSQAVVRIKKEQNIYIRARRGACREMLFHFRSEKSRGGRERGRDASHAGDFVSFRRPLITPAGGKGARFFFTTCSSSRGISASGDTIVCASCDVIFRILLNYNCLQALRGFSGSRFVQTDLQGYILGDDVKLAISS